MPKKFKKCPFLLVAKQNQMIFTEKKERFILPWLFLSIPQFTFITSALILECYTLSGTLPMLILSMMVLFFPILAANVYSWFIVWAVYEDLHEKNNSKIINKPCFV